MAASVVYNMFKYPDVIKDWPHYKKSGTITGNWCRISLPGSVVNSEQLGKFDNAANLPCVGCE